MKKAILIKGVPDEQRKSCFDCRYCQGAVSWWCINEEAIDYRGTSIPGVHNCHFWKPIQVWNNLKWWKKLFNTDIKIEVS